MLDSPAASGEILNRDALRCTAGEGVTSGSKTWEMEPNPSPGESIALRQGLGGISMWLVVGDVGPEKGAWTS